MKRAGNGPFKKRTEINKKRPRLANFLRIACLKLSKDSNKVTYGVKTFHEFRHNYQSDLKNTMSADNYTMSCSSFAISWVNITMPWTNAAISWVKYYHIWPEDYHVWSQYYQALSQCCETRNQTCLCCRKGPKRYITQFKFYLSTYLPTYLQG